MHSFFATKILEKCQVKGLMLSCLLSEDKRRVNSEALLNEFKPNANPSAGSPSIR